MAIREYRFDVVQLSRIAKSCSRWAAVESLPQPIRCRMDELNRWSQSLLTAPASQEDQSSQLLLLKKKCRALRVEFAKIDVSFDCPWCPLSADKPRQ